MTVTEDEVLSHDQLTIHALGVHRVQASVRPQKYLPVLESPCIAKSEALIKWDVPQDVLDTSKVDRLASHMKAFLSFKVVTTQGRSESGLMTSASLKHYKSILLEAVGRKVYAGAPPTEVGARLAAVFAKGPYSSSKGLYGQLGTQRRLAHQPVLAAAIRQDKTSSLWS